jgi:hypothetical protein
MFRSTRLNGHAAYGIDQRIGDVVTIARTLADYLICHD